MPSWCISQSGLISRSLITFETTLSTVKSTSSAVVNLPIPKLQNRRAKRKQGQEQKLNERRRDVLHTESLHRESAWRVYRPRERMPEQFRLTGSKSAPDRPGHQWHAARTKAPARRRCMRCQMKEQYPATATATAIETATETETAEVSAMLLGKRAPPNRSGTGKVQLVSAPAP